ncbi:BA75_03142T0 [Komagataella pastoris]|uniref:BA75_03142T0 n=1 Tax=Komagataella pastoris TaxID=4922 RepID=A0A1B2JCB2_PICPA|nr:BA75_03142T0 [Komagataella pastoris]
MDMKSRSKSNLKRLTVYKNQPKERGLQVTREINFDQELSAAYKFLYKGICKFEGSKSGVSKTNFLRVWLLPFLRNTAVDSNIIIGKIPHSVIEYGFRILLQWWEILLNILTNSSQPSQKPASALKSSDVPLILECISRIISRPEWYNITQDENENYTKYQDHLAKTLEYCIFRLNSKTKKCSLQVNGMIGKVFAYSFYHLNNVSNALLFIFNIRNSKYFRMCKFHNGSNQKAKNGCAAPNPFPQFLPASKLYDYKGRAVKEKINSQQNKHLNSMEPPVGKVPGILEPRGVWVARWVDVDTNIDVFSSFLFHYLKIINGYICHSGVSDYDILKFPGFIHILCHIEEIIDHAFECRSAFKKHNSSNNNINYSSNNILSMVNNFNYELPAPIMKLFKTFRYLSYDKERFDVALIDTFLSKIDRTLVKMASSISCYDYYQSCVVLDLFYQLVLHVDNSATSCIDWSFWLEALFRLLTDTLNIICELKALSILFNVWSFIPHPEEPIPSKTMWLTSPEKGYRWNSSYYLLSHWDKFFNHWQPLLRCYYQHLIIWKVIGVLSFKSYRHDEVKSLVTKKLKKSHSIAVRMAELVPELEAKPSTPLLNHILTITSNGGSKKNNGGYNFQSILSGEDLTMATTANASSNADDDLAIDKKTTYPFEVFDDSVYTWAGVPIVVPKSSNKISKHSSSATLSTIQDTDEAPKSPSSNGSSFVHSLESALKFFKNKSDSATNSPTNSPKTQSVSGSEASTPKESLGASVARKKFSSSLSLSSLKSAFDSPTSSVVNVSLDDESSNFDVKSVSSDKSGFSIFDDTFGGTLGLTSDSQPREFKIMLNIPKVIKPLYKFQLIPVDSQVNKHLRLMGSKARILEESSIITAPRLPRLSSSIYRENSGIGLIYSSSSDSGASISDSESLYLGMADGKYKEKKYCTPLSSPSIDTNASELGKKKANKLSQNQHHHLIQKWGTIGKSLNEWDSFVKEYETFCNEKQLQLELGDMNVGMLNNATTFSQAGARRYEHNPDNVHAEMELLIPYLPAESPNKMNAN